MKEKVKNNIAYIILFVFLLSFLFVYLILQNNKNEKTVQKNIVTNIEKETMNVNQETPVSETLDLTSPIVTTLKNKISIFDTYKSGSYYGYFYQSDYLDINNIKDDVKILIGITQNDNFDNDFFNATYKATTQEGNDIEVIILSKEEVKDGIESFFGPNISYNDTDLIDANYDYCGFSRFKYDTTRKVYISETITCSGFPSPYIDSKIISAIKTDNKIELTIKIAYVKYDRYKNDNIIKYIYKDYNDIKYLDKFEILKDNSYDINNYLDKLNTFKFTFTLNSNNYYYFESVKKVI